MTGSSSLFSLVIATEIGTSFSIPVSMFTLVAKTRANDGRPWKDFYAKDPEKTVQVV